MNWQLRQKLTGNSAGDEYGHKVATNADGTILMMSSRFDESTGGVLIYTGNTTNQWTLKQRITGDSTFDQFGFSIATNANGTVLMIGGTQDDDSGTNAGAALIYTGNATAGWQFKQKLTGDSAGDIFGTSVATNSDGSILMMGGVNDANGGINAGAALVYTGNAIAGWQLRQKLNGNKANGFFGYSTTTNSDGTVLMMGGYDSSFFNRGAALVYTGNAIAGWQLRQILTGDSQNSYGHNVAINDNGTILMMRGFVEEIGEGGDGSIYVYTGNAINGWQFKQKLIGDNISHNYGNNVATNADGNIIMMGGYQQDYDGLEVVVYTGDATAGWQLNQKLTGDSFGDNFGDSVATNNDGSILLIGGRLDSNGGTNAGAALVYSLSTPIFSKWIEISNVGKDICPQKSSNCIKIINLNNDIYSQPQLTCRIDSLNTLESFGTLVNNTVIVRNKSNTAYKKGALFLIDPGAKNGYNYTNNSYIFFDNIYSSLLISLGNQEGTSFAQNDIIQFEFNNSAITNRVNLFTDYKASVINSLSGPTDQVLLIECLPKNNIKIIDTRYNPIPSPPSQVTISDVGFYNFVISWNKVPKATAYRLDIARNVEFTNFASFHNNLLVNGTSYYFLDTNFILNRTYYIRVRSENEFGTSANSQTIIQTTILSL